MLIFGVPSGKLQALKKSCEMISENPPKETDTGESDHDQHPPQLRLGTHPKESASVSAFQSGHRICFLFVCLEDKTIRAGLSPAVNALLAFISHQSCSFLLSYAINLSLFSFIL